MLTKSLGGGGGGGGGGGSKSEILPAEKNKYKKFLLRRLKNLK